VKPEEISKFASEAARIVRMYADEKGIFRKVLSWRKALCRVVYLMDFNIAFRYLLYMFFFIGIIYVIVIFYSDFQSDHLGLRPYSGFVLPGIIVLVIAVFGITFY